MTRRDCVTPGVCLVAWVALALWVRPDRIVTSPFELPIALTIGGGLAPWLRGRRSAAIWFLAACACAIAYQLWALDTAHALGVEVADLPAQASLDPVYRRIGRRAAYLTTAALTAWMVLARRFAFPRTTDDSNRRTEIPSA